MKVQDDALSALNYRPGVDRRGRPKTGRKHSAWVPFFTTDEMKAALVAWAKDEDRPVAWLLRRLIADALNKRKRSRRRT